MGAPAEAELCEVGGGRRGGSDGTSGQESGYLAEGSSLALVSLNGCQGFWYLSVFSSRNGDIGISPTNLTGVVV